MNPEDLTLLYICERQESENPNGLIGKVHVLNEKLFKRDLVHDQHIFFVLDTPDDLNIKEGDKFAVLVAKIK